jgi:hypothetical protein
MPSKLGGWFVSVTHTLKASSSSSVTHTGTESILLLPEEVRYLNLK